MFIDSRAKFAPTFQPTDETTVVVASSYVMPQPPAPVHPHTGSSNNVTANGSGSGASPAVPSATEPSQAGSPGRVAAGEKLKEEGDSPPTNANGTIADETNDPATRSLPPPPEVAERIIANLLPRYVNNFAVISEFWREVVGNFVGDFEEILGIYGIRRRCAKSGFSTTETLLN